MSVGIIGAGHLGSNFARALARKNIPAMIASRRGPDALGELASQLGTSIRPASVTEAAQADMVLVALRWTDLESALRPLAGLALLALGASGLAIAVHRPIVPFYGRWLPFWLIVSQLSQF